MKLAGRATIFELRDMIGDEQITTSKGRAVPEPFYDGLLARLRSAWEIVCGRAYPVAWPESGDLEKALGPRTGRWPQRMKA